jgi:hypothetical protein
MVVPFHPNARRTPRGPGTPLDALLRTLHEAGDGEDLQAAVDRIAESERVALLSTLKRLCELLESPQPPASGRTHIPF